MWDSRIKRTILISVLSLFGLVLLIYEYGIIISRDNYAPGTWINGHYFGMKPVKSAEEELYENPADYVLEVKFRDADYQIYGHDIDLNYSFTEDLEKIKNGQVAYLWPESFFVPGYEIEKKITYNEAKLIDLVESFDSMRPENMKEPENPTIELGKDGIVVAVAQDPGSVIEDTDGVIAAIEKSVMNEEPRLDIEEEGFYKISEYTVDSAKVKKCVDYCNTIVGLDVIYQYADTEIALEPFQLYGVIKISDTYDTIISKQRVADILEGFARLHDTYSSIRKFKNHNHDLVTVTNSDYGWEMDVEKETDSLYSDLIHHRGMRRPPEFIHSGFTYGKNGDDIGGTYAEVDLNAQMMYYYKNYRLVLNTEVVTGNVNLGRSTPPGIYDVDYHQSPATLKGEDYETKVTYWMPFNGGIGFHDATWRGGFGGDIYLYDGSHGCINMPYYMAEELFMEIEDGMPVIVY